ncbi:MAG TPA: tRNA (N6-threonylcarbamoyladenosine(37)-N6)-methyltransferase TrmO [Candidatus Altiarchaeales archaeon]|nr:tRNA (N6-threonylcarbamoyladenosine(37)-N6)-methyltransferase TrmO [Candidatus Altiarchaeales archaeon]
MKIVLNPIGVIHTEFKRMDEMPIQGGLFPDNRGVVEVFREYAGGLSDIDGFSHIILTYFFSQSNGFELKVKPFLEERVRGVFSTRAPRRPNPIGITVVKLDSVEGNTLNVRGVDMLDGTPLLDIKPYIPEFDVRSDAETGWIRERVGGAHLSDGRFKR